MRSVGFIVLLLIVLVSESQASDSSDHPFWGICFSANIPREPLGFSIWGVGRKGNGIYGDLKWFPNLRGEGDSDFYGNISVHKAEDIWGDELIDKETSWLTVNVAVVKLLNPKLAWYLGGGITDKRNYRQYYDELEILGRHGRYWIEGHGSGFGLNVLGGLLVSLQRNWVIQIGAEANPGGITLGVGKSYPIGSRR